MLFRVYFILLGLLLSGTLIAQDEHFSQFFALPTHMNPALTGAYDGTYRMTAVYRDQWGSRLDSPYSTLAAGGDTKINMKLNGKTSDDHVGIGLFFISDRFNAYQAATNKLQSSFAYHKRLGDKSNSYLGAGLQLGIVQRNINYDNLLFEDQFNQLDAFDLATGEVLPPNNFGSFDFSLGVNYYSEFEKSALYVGVAAHHINNPSFSYFDKLDLPNPSIDISQKLNTRLVFHLSYDRALSYSTTLQPRIIYQKQGEQTRIDLGSNIEYTLKSRNSAVYIGGWLGFTNDLDGSRIETITPLIGIRQKQFILGFSYDIYMTDVFDQNYGFNAFEVSIRFSGEHKNTGAFCPTF